MLVLVAIFGLTLWRRDSKRRRAGLVAPPPAVTLAQDRRRARGRRRARPALQPRSRKDRADPRRALGRAPRRRRARHLDGPPRPDEVRALLLRDRRQRRGCAPRRREPGDDPDVAFMLCSLTAGIAGIVYASRLRSISTSIDGGTLVLYAVAAAVIGGTSLFGGRGKAIHGVLGGIVIAAIYNGMGLRGYTAASQVHGHCGRPARCGHDRRALTARPRRNLSRRNRGAAMAELALVLGATRSRTRSPSQSGHVLVAVTICSGGLVVVDLVRAFLTRRPANRCAAPRGLRARTTGRSLI